MSYGSKDLVDRMDETVAIVKRNGFDEQPLPTLVALLHSECTELLEANPESAVRDKLNATRSYRHGDKAV